MTNTSHEPPKRKRRSPGEGAVFYDKARDRWTAVVDLGIDPSGRRNRRKVSAKTKTEAKQKLRSLQALAAQGLPVGDGGLTVRAFLEEWLEKRVPVLKRVKSRNTRENYGWAVREHLIPALGAKKLVALSADDIDRMLDAKATEGLGSSSLRRLVTVLRKALRDAERRGKVQRNVAMLVDVPETHRRQARSLVVDEARSLLLAARGDRLEAAWWLGLCLGLRPGEIFGLRWNEVDLDAGVLHIVGALKREGSSLILGDVKTERSRRTLYLSPSIVLALRNHRARHAQERLAAPVGWNPLGLVFCSPLGAPVDPSNARRSLNLVAKSAGVGHLRIYDLRHSCATLMSNEGIRVEIIGDVFGHDGTRMAQQVYRHPGTESVRAATDAMESLFEAQ